MTTNESPYPMIEIETALTLTPEQWKHYHPTQATGIITLSEREKRAYQTAKNIAAQLRQKFFASRVVLFGSLAHAGWFTRWSDIDLAVWGIPPDQFYQVVAVATRLSDEFEVDVVDPHDCRPAIREAIEQEGVEL